MNFANDKLFSVGDDGVLAIFSILDKEPKKNKDQAVLPSITISDEILIQKSKRDTLQADIRKYRADIKMHQDAHQTNIANELEANETKIKALDKQISQQKMEADSKNGLVQQEKNQIELAGHQEIERLRKLHNEELKIKKREHEEKMYHDNERYQELLHQKEEQERRFRQKISELHLLQEKQYKELKVEHDLQKKEKDQERKNLQQTIDEMLKINKDERKLIEDKAWD